MFTGFNWQQMVSAFIVLFAVIDIIGSIPIIINLKEKGKDVNAMKATVISFALLIGFFYAGDMKDILNREFIEKHGTPDVIITDPPRAGMHTDVIDTILFASPQRIVYLSCNPATQARDLQLLSVAYQVKAVQPVDMFPQTHHVENVVLLEKITN